MALVFCTMGLVIAGASGASAGVSAPPKIPAGGAYLGAWVNPLGLYSYGGANEIPQLAKFNRDLGKTVSILHVYVLFTDPFPAATLAAIDANGSIPMVDWSCTAVSQINSGADDAAITAYAQGFKASGKPAFLRWYWEMNLNTSAHIPCGGYNNGPAFIAAWQRIWNIFHRVGATNVAFVWCASAHIDASPYYPGDAYVDWLGADNYDRAHLGALAFHRSFDHFYGQWLGRNKPIMVGETGATTVDQAQYIQNIQSLVPASYPGIKAILYFDAPGNSDNWSLVGSGFAAFKTLAATAYFSYR